MTGEGPPAMVHVDLDGAVDIYRVHGWPYPYGDDPVFETGMRNLLALLDDLKLTATLFTIGTAAKDPAKREWLQEAHNRGHEIAGHSLTHPLLTTIPIEERRREIEGCREVIERELGVAVTGFRAPGYHVDRACLELIAEAGYVYDSSAFPNHRSTQDLGVAPATVRWPGRPFPGLDLIELSLPDYRPFPVPFFPSYALTLGEWLFRTGVQRLRRRDVRHVTLLFHLIDFSAPLPAERRAGWRQTLFTLSQRSEAAKMRSCRRMLEYAVSRFRMTSTQDLLAALQEGQSTDREVAGG